jgi:hypothetical protein
MKPRHAAALALVGWYLTFPPLVCVKNRPPVQEGNATILHRPCEYDPRRPLSEWTIVIPYDTAVACDREALRLHDGTAAQAVDEKTDRKNPGFKNWLASGVLADVQCIASDDPRLKGK